MKKILGKGHHSLRVKMTVCLLVLLGISILGCWILSLTMMESYFVRSERKNLTNVYKMIDEELEKKGSVNTLYLEGIAAKNNINKEKGYNSVATIDSILNSPIPKIMKDERTEVAI